MLRATARLAPRLAPRAEAALGTRGMSMAGLKSEWGRAGCAPPSLRSDRSPARRLTPGPLPWVQATTTVRPPRRCAPAGGGAARRRGAAGAAARLPASAAGACAAASSPAAPPPLPQMLYFKKVSRHERPPRWKRPAERRSAAAGMAPWDPVQPAACLDDCWQRGCGPHSMHLGPAWGRRWRSRATRHGSCPHAMLRARLPPAARATCRWLLASQRAAGAPPACCCRRMRSCCASC